LDLQSRVNKDMFVRQSFERVSSSGPAPRQNGFTLVEILIAISLMAVLTLMCWRGLESVLRGRDRILSTGEAMQSLSTTMAQLDEDLRRSQTLRLILLRDPIALQRSANGPILAVDRPLSGVSQGMVQRVEWRVLNKRLERGFSDPESPLAQNSGRVLTWQTLLEPVDSWNIRVLRKNLRQQWFDAQAEVTGSAQTGDVVGLDVSMISAEQKITRMFVIED
jgi:general secretion pathway protein J